MNKVKQNLSLFFVKVNMTSDSKNSLDYKDKRFVFFWKELEPFNFFQHSISTGPNPGFNHQEKVSNV